MWCLQLMVINGDSSADYVFLNYLVWNYLKNLRAQSDVTPVHGFLQPTAQTSQHYPINEKQVLKLCIRHVICKGIDGMAKYFCNICGISVSSNSL